MDGIGRAIDIGLHLVPALVALMLVVVAFQMAHGEQPVSQPAGETLELRVSDR